MSIRTSRPADRERIIEIYNQAVETGLSTADLSPASVESRTSWFNQHAADSYPIYVEEAQDEIRGWCSLSPYRPGRMALRHTAEISYYVGLEYQRMGVASRLIRHAMADCPRLGIKTLFGILLDTNEVSMRMLDKLSFERWGHMPDVADFDGRECGHVYMGRRVG